MAAQVDRCAVDERDLEREDVVGPVLLDSLRAGGDEAVGGVELAVGGHGHALQHLLAHHLAVEQRHVEDGDALERSLHLHLVALVNALPFLKQLVVKVRREQPVHDHRVGHVAEEAQVAEGALGLLDDHLLQVEHDAHRRDRRVGQHLAHPVEVHQEILQRREDLVLRQRDVHQRLQHRPRDAHRPALPGVDLVEPPFGGVGKCEQLQGLAGRRAVDDQHVVLGALRVVLDPHQRGDLVHPGRVGDLLGHDLVEALGGENLDRVLVELRPVPLHLVQRRDLVRPEVVGDLGERRAELDVERVAQGVGGVRAHDHRAIAGLRAVHGGRRGDRGLAHAALACEEDHAHRTECRREAFGPPGRPNAGPYLIRLGIAKEPAARSTTMAPATTARRTRSFVK